MLTCPNSQCEEVGFLISGRSSSRCSISMLPLNEELLTFKRRRRRSSSSIECLHRNDLAELHA